MFFHSLFLATSCAGLPWLRRALSIPPPSNTEGDRRWREARGQLRIHLPFTIHHSPFTIPPPAAALPSPCSRILNPKSCLTPRSILAYVFRFVKRHGVRFGPAREARAPAPGVIPVPHAGGIHPQPVPGKSVQDAEGERCPAERDPALWPTRGPKAVIRPPQRDYLFPRGLAWPHLRRRYESLPTTMWQSAMGLERPLRNEYARRGRARGGFNVIQAPTENPVAPPR